MDAFPHHYRVEAFGNETGDVAVSSEHLPVLDTAAPAEFGGPGDRWSPESLLVASVANCFVLTFRAIARFSKLPWESLTCEVEGVLDRVERSTQFTEFVVRVTLQVPEGTSPERAQRLLERAEQTCLITNSLKAGCRLDATVETGKVERRASSA